MKKTRDNCLFHCECLSLAISSLPLNLNEEWAAGLVTKSGAVTPDIPCVWYR